MSVEARSEEIGIEVKPGHRQWETLVVRCDSVPGHHPHPQNRNEISVGPKSRSAPGRRRQPRPTRGMFVAITVMKRTLASRGRPAI